jgi:Protein of function (DUF2518)
MPQINIDFALIAQYMGILVLVCALITGIAFARMLGWRFRMVGVTSFAVVLTIGLFTLSLNPVTRESVPGAVHFSLVYDRMGPQAVIAVPPDITAEQLEATLKQAASNLFSPGRNGQGRTAEFTIRARTVLHPREGVSQPLYIGQVTRSLRRRDDPNIRVEIFRDKLASIPAATTSN